MAVAQKSKQLSRAMAAQPSKRAQPAKVAAKVGVKSAKGGAKPSPGKPPIVKVKSVSPRVAKGTTAPIKVEAMAVESPQIVKAKAALKKENKVALAVPVAKSEKAVSAIETRVEKPAKVAVKSTPAEKKANRAEARAKSRKISIEASANEAASALLAKWSMLYKKAEQIENKPYNMKGTFEEKTAIMHKLLGWGYILANRNDRLEVLFKDGIKYLISNYKP